MDITLQREKQKEVLEDIITVCNKPGYPAADKLVDIVGLISYLCLWEMEQEDA